LPTAPALPCPRPGCPYLQPCSLHPRKPFMHAKSYNHYGPEHKAWRAAVLARDPICKMCNRMATEAHHIIPIRKGGARYDVANGVGLCHRHHSQATGRETRG
jgi:5-methylcytosine-specific restriction endonuclease McrA